jgi:hypothetical protein
MIPLLDIKDDTFEKIEKYYHQKGKLTEKELEICSRWELVFTIFFKQKERKITISKYMAILNRKGTPQSIAQCYSDLRNAEKLFTPLQKYSKEFVRLVIIESAMRDVKRCESMIREQKNIDIKSWSEIMKVKDKAEKRIIDAAGLMVNDPQLPDFSKLVPSTFNINLDPKAFEMMKTFISKGNVDVTEVFKQMSTDTEIEE